MRLMNLGMWLAALFNPKARKWVEGRRNWRQQYQADMVGASGVLWVHAASLGEFEQGRPLIEAFRTRHPDWKIVLSFFSPSGYEIRKNYPYADLICYLPADTRRNARDFLDIIRPDAAIFVKYEFWGNYLHELKKRNTPTLLVSALFRPEQPFFQWYGAYWRDMLRCFTHFFVQNKDAENLLQSIGFHNITVAGDTRVDRVLTIAAQAPENELVAAFTAGQAPVLIAGSSWEADEKIYLPVLQEPEFQYLKLIIAPHDVAESNVVRTYQSVKKDDSKITRYSRADKKTSAAARVLLIDNIGLLNTLYRYGTIAYIGGGFGKGIHNTLEPAAFGLPVIFGPAYRKFEEARQLLELGGAFSVKSSAELADILRKLQEPDFYKQSSEAALGWLEQNKGATEKILAFMEKR